MRRKLLIIFLTIISAVCLCISISACDILTDYTGSYSYSSTNNSSSKNSNSNSNSGSSSNKNSSSNTGSVSEEDLSGDDDTEQGSTSGADTEQGSTSGDDTEQGSTGSDDKQDESGDVTADFTVRDGNSDYGYCQLASEADGDAMQSVYYNMYTACEAFTASTENITATAIDTKTSAYVLSEITYSSSLTSSEALGVWKIFYSENPMYYWLSSACYTSGNTLYLCIDGTYAKYSARSTYDAAISSMVKEANALVAQNSTELEKAMTIHDYIVSKIDYAYLSDGVTPETSIWAHNITGVSSMGYGVCEAYSKTYLALCLMNGLDCVIVTGSANGGDHAWNLVEIDGVWYGVDCTWDDTGDNDDLSYAYFGMNASALTSTRTAEAAYDLPEVTDYAIQLVTLFKGETEMGMYVNIDAAFAAMTDATADYTIEFYFSNTSGTVVYTSPATTMYIYSSSTPAVNSITINGVYTALESGFYVSYLNTDGKFTLNCNFAISDIIYTAADLDLSDYTLTAGGCYCRLNGSVYDSKTTDAVSVKSETSLQTDIYAALNVSYYYGSASISGTANIGTYYGSDKLSVYGTVTIGAYISANETNYYNIYLQEGSTLTINNLVYDSNGTQKIIYVLIQFNSIEKYPALYMGNVDAQTNLYVSGSVSSSEAATPDNLSCAIATLGNASDFTNIRVYFDNANKTSLYTVNTDNQIVYSTAG